MGESIGGRDSGRVDLAINLPCNRSIRSFCRRSARLLPSWVIGPTLLFHSRWEGFLGWSSAFCIGCVGGRIADLPYIVDLDRENFLAMGLNLWIGCLSG